MLCTEDRILLFLMRMRRRVPFEGMRLLFGVSIGTVCNYYGEMLKRFHVHVVPRLLYPLSGPAVDAMTPQNVKDDLPGARVIWDGTGLALKCKENTTVGRLLYSGYHHRPEAMAVFGNGAWLWHCAPLIADVLGARGRLYDERIVDFSLALLWWQFVGGYNHL